MNIGRTEFTVTPRVLKMAGSDGCNIRKDNPACANYVECLYNGCDANPLEFVN